jgi:hypothetical protein
MVRAPAILEMPCPLKWTTVGLSLRSARSRSSERLRRPTRLEYEAVTEAAQGSSSTWMARASLSSASRSIPTGFAARKRIVCMAKATYATVAPPRGPGCRSGDRTRDSTTSRVEGVNESARASTEATSEEAATCRDLRHPFGLPDRDGVRCVAAGGIGDEQLCQRPGVWFSYCDVEPCRGRSPPPALFAPLGDVRERPRARTKLPLARGAVHADCFSRIPVTSKPRFSILRSKRFTDFVLSRRRRWSEPRSR